MDKNSIYQYYNDDFLKRVALEGGEPVIAGSRELLSRLKDASVKFLVLNSWIDAELDYRAVIIEAKAKLLPNGRLWATLKSFAPPVAKETNYWGFTLAAAKFIFSEYFGEANVKAFSRGNVLVGSSLINGLSPEHLTKEQLNFADPYFPILIEVNALNKGYAEED